VIRRFIETDFTPINLNELQCWVGSSNILVTNFVSNTLVSYFANWENKQVALAGRADGATFNIYINLIDYGIHSDDNTINSLMIRNVPLTNINDLQELVSYNRKQGLAERAIIFFLNSTTQ
jgi:hypothetical protein